MAITLMKPDDIRQAANVTTYAHSKITPLLIWLACLCVAIVMLVHNGPHFHPLKIFAVVGLLFLFLFKRFIIAPFQSSNWLVRTAEDGLYVQFRSYLNYRWPALTPTVAFIPYCDIRSARLVRETVTVPRLDRQNASSTEFHRYVELELISSTESLSAALQEERNHSPPDNTATYRDYPVTLKVPPFLRIEWNVRPNARTFLKRLPASISIHDPVKLREDFTNVHGLDAKQQEQRIRELDRRGRRLEAIYLAQRVRCCGLTEATHYVDQLEK
ncbi:MAG: hypothetical protein ABUS47_08490 [Steroidobacter sp.]